MNIVLPATAFSILIVMVPGISYSETLNYQMHGWGYRVLSDSITDTSIRLDLNKETTSNKAMFEQGHLSIGDSAQQINKLDALFLQNERMLRLSGVMSDGTMLAATGRLLAINEYGAVYDLRGNVVKNGVMEKIFLYVTLQQIENTTKKSEYTVSEDSKQDSIFLVKHSDVVEWKSKYEFTARVFDPLTNLGSNFYHPFGFFRGVHISATITNPAGNVINTINGTTDDAGYFVGSMIIPDNSMRGMYRLDARITDDAFKTKSVQLFFEVIPV
ncbi:hypothetical protein [Candidatus Nitrosotenuis uzonensis]|uniref:Uncharacterized protein n=1 Tax=Candidatus Nitrosotenuis uzonensis TaxID=1407055 RepID=A0A812F2W0_9ARCH|nr:hypothetical protein [Candidatus Nitrosotenuis uzonensis]MCA2004135.1 hypothetical protein [Candidatus Nitrosotenuis sp.]CAE6496862.1 conserved hypothetical protein [Candidatus Nitrosotenuis uzonensis]